MGNINHTAHHWYTRHYNISAIQDFEEKIGKYLKASIPQQIEQLAKLKDQGILSEVEFEKKKEELLLRSQIT